MWGQSEIWAGATLMNKPRQVLEEAYPWLDTIYVEAVPEGEVEGIIDRLINQEKVDVVVTTSFGFMDGTLNAAKKILG